MSINYGDFLRYAAGTLCVAALAGLVLIGLWWLVRAVRDA